MIRTVMESWKAKLQDNYTDLAEFEQYDEMYGLAQRLGYESAEEAWNENPMIEGSADPKDFKKTESTKTESTDYTIIPSLQIRKFSGKKWELLIDGQKATNINQTDLGEIIEAINDGDTSGSLSSGPTWELKTLGKRKSESIEEAVGYDYYKNQLSRILPLDEYGARIKITSSTGSTNYLELNEESLAALTEFVKGNTTVSEVAPQVPQKESLMVHKIYRKESRTPYRFIKDANGVPVSVDDRVYVFPESQNGTVYAIYKYEDDSTYMNGIYAFVNLDDTGHSAVGYKGSNIIKN